MDYISREQAYELLKKYNQDPFHIQHALTVEAVMKWYAKELGHHTRRSVTWLWHYGRCRTGI